MKSDKPGASGAIEFVGAQPGRLTISCMIADISTVFAITRRLDDQLLRVRQEKSANTRAACPVRFALRAAAFISG